MRNPNCTACPLHQTATNVCVWGAYEHFQGAQWAQTAFVVGEAPGSREDQSGTPFVGPSGKLLKQALAEIGIEDAYFTNTVKCFSDGPPKPVSVKACADYLDKEIAAQKPKVILALGATAWKRLGGKGTITAAAGTEVWSDKYQCHIFPALHPAAVLHNRGYENAWKLTLRRYALLLKGKAKTQVPVSPIIIAPNASKYADMLLDLASCPSGYAFDIETNRLPWWHKNYKIISVAYSNGKNTYASDSVHLLPYAMNVPVTAHNAAFDALGVYRVGGVLPKVTCDTMVLAHLLDENSPKRLKWLTRAYLGWPDWSIDTKNLTTATPDVLRYNGYDAAATFQLRELLLDKLRQDPQLERYFAHVVMPGLRAVLNIIKRGIPVNKTVLQNRITTATMRMQVAAQQIPVQNPASNRQLAEWLYVKEGLPVLKYTPTGQAATDEETINKLAQAYPQSRLVVEFRKWHKMLGTWLLPVLHMIENSFDGRAHHEYRPATVETGRYSSPFHTTPRDPFIRDIYQ